ncbi:amino acid adenylation domain-containing protein [Fulvimarina sp. MAC8]|uniref:amino acid adenylation domain-containing protein n=1 Tax=Fulvimarina sp. MAC8 TaxID=3162874 RepID=UPI0032EB32B3
MSQPVDLFDLTPMQAGMLFHSLMEPDSGTYFEQCWCTVEGTLDEAAFVAAWREVIRRHEVLRSECHWVDLDRPVQVVYDDAEPEWTRLDWSDLDRRAQEERFASWQAGERARGFQLDRAPLLRFALIRLVEGRYRFVWSFHHLLMDGWCSALLVRDMMRLYSGKKLGPPPPPYKRYVEWLADQDKEEAETYWRSELAGAAPVDLSALKAPDSANADKGALELRRRLDPGLSARLTAVAKRERITLATLLQGAWALLLARYSGQEDIVFGNVLAGRPAELPGADTMVGLFLRTVPGRVRIEPALDLAEWLRGLQRSAVERERHSHVAVTDINRWGGAGPEMPLFESVLIVENIPLSMQNAFAAEATSFSLSDPGSFERTHYPLVLRVFPGEETELALTVDARRIASDRTNAILDHFQNLLKAFCTGMGEKLDRLDILSAEERGAILEAAEDPHDPPRAPLIPAAIMARAQSDPARVALRLYGEGHVTEWRYCDLAARAQAIAAGLAARGYGRGCVIAVHLPREPDLIASLLGVMLAGGTYLPLDPDYPEERIAYMLGDSGASLVIGRDLSCGASSEIVDPDALTAQTPDVSREPVRPLQGDDLAYLLYTSGSTGTPKGVAIRHDALANFIASMQRRPGIAATDRLLALTTIGFDIAGLELFGPLAAGGTVALADTAAARDGSRLTELVAKERPTLMQATPSGWRMLLESGWQGDRALRVLCGGEALSSALAHKLLEHCGELWNLYGPTETTIWSAAVRLERSMLTGPNAPVGPPIDRTGLYILDRRNEPVANGVAGELYISGAGLSPFYWNRAALTAERFVPNPFASNAQDGLNLYRTGDLVRRREDGLIDFLGRTDGQIKLRGHRIELGEIEATLSAHPAVLAAVAVVEEKPSGPRLHAWLRWRSEPVDEATLRGHLAARLPAYMIPSGFSGIDCFPLTPNGKVDRNALAAMESATPLLRPVHRPLSSPTSEALAELWCKALEIDHVGPDDNFFARGGHSLLVISMQSQVQERFGAELPITDFFRFPTLETLAAQIDRIAGGTSAIDPAVSRAELRKAGRDRLARRRGDRSVRHP